MFGYIKRRIELSKTMTTPAYCRSVCYDDSARGPVRDFSASTITMQQLVAQCAHCDAGGGGGGAGTNDHFWMVSQEPIAGAMITPRDNLRENVPANPAMPTFNQTFLFGSATTESTAGALPSRMMYIHTAVGDSDEGFFAAGYATGTQWNYSNRGLHAAVFNSENISRGTSSFTAGDSNENSGDSSACFGRNNQLLGNAEFMAGLNNEDDAVSNGNGVFGNNNTVVSTVNSIIVGVSNTETSNDGGAVFGEDNVIASSAGFGRNLVGGLEVRVTNANASTHNNIFYGRSMTLTPTTELQSNIVTGNGHSVLAPAGLLRFNAVSGQLHSLQSGSYQANLLYGESISFVPGTVAVAQNSIGGFSQTCTGTINQCIIGGNTHTVNTSTTGSTLRTLICGQTNLTENVENGVIFGRGINMTSCNQSTCVAGLDCRLTRAFNSVVGGLSTVLSSLNTPSLPPIPDPNNSCNFLFSNESTISNTNSTLGATSRLNNNAILGGFTNTIEVPAPSPGEFTECSIIGGVRNSILSSSPVASCGHFSGTDNTIDSNNGAALSGSVVLGGSNHFITSDSATAIENCAILGGAGNTHTTVTSSATLRNSVILGGTNLTLQEGGLDSQTAYAQRMRIQHSIQHEGFVFTDTSPYTPTISDHLICLGPNTTAYIVDLRQF
jgi:hypothetical protein